MPPARIPSNTAIDLIDHRLSRKRRPVPTLLVESAGNSQVPNLRRIFDDLDEQSAAQVPRDVAVERPHSRIVRIDLDDDVTIGSQHLRVSSLRVVGAHNGLAIPCTTAFGLRKR